MKEDICIRKMREREIEKGKIEKNVYDQRERERDRKRQNEKEKSLKVRVGLITPPPLPLLKVGGWLE